MIISFLVGDFNCTDNHALDRNHLEPHPASGRTLCEVFDANNLCDVWCRRNNKNKQYTWAHSRDNVISLARLDRFDCFRHHFNIV